MHENHLHIQCFSFPCCISYYQLWSSSCFFFFFFFMYRDDQCLVAVLSITNSECQEMKIKCLSFFKTAHPLNYYDYFFKKALR